MNKYNNFSETVQKNSSESITKYYKEEIFEGLKSNDEELKPFLIMEINSINNKEEFDILLFHLTNHDGRIREAVSCILLELGSVDNSFIEKFSDENTNVTFLNSILDINPNVARNIIELIQMTPYLKKELFFPITNKIEDSLSKLSVFVKGDEKFFSNKSKSLKNHAKNKLTFNLYWLLEALSVSYIEEGEKITSILTDTSNFLDYTIREKTAKVLSKMKNPPKELLRKLKNDVNFYVKNQLL